MFGDQLQFGFQLGGCGAGQFGGQFGQFGGGGGQFGCGGGGSGGSGQFGQFGGGGGQFGCTGFNFGCRGAPIAVARGAFKVGENGTPRPQDRVSMTYNYYSNVLRALQVHRETVDVEKTFLDNRASIEVRLPFIQNRGDLGESESEVADPTAIFKYALVNRTGILSGGLAVTIPTSNIPTVLAVRQDGSFEKVHPTLIQPFVGYEYPVKDFFVQGFSSFMVPTDSRDGTLMFNDIGIGYWIRRRETGRLRGIVPTFETHINTPLTNRGFPGFADTVNLTAGSHFFLGDRWRFGVAAGRKVQGPTLFSYEALGNLSWSF
jgi:hypothetical protein